MPQKRPRHIPIQAFTPVEGEMIEVLDERSSPFMIMPRAAAVSQNLFHRVVLVLVRNREGQVYIHRRSENKKNYGGLWSVSASGFVKAGEAVEDAALRELGEELGVGELYLTQVATAEPTAETDYAQISLFLSSPANVLLNPNPDEISEGMFVDEDELAAILRDMPEMTTPALKWAASVVNLFSA